MINILATTSLQNYTESFQRVIRSTVQHTWVFVWFSGPIIASALVFIHRGWHIQLAVLHTAVGSYHLSRVSQTLGQIDMASLVKQPTYPMNQSADLWTWPQAQEHNIITRLISCLHLVYPYSLNHRMRQVEIPRERVNTLVLPSNAIRVSWT